MTIERKKSRIRSPVGELYDAMLAESREQTAALAKGQNLLFGYAAAMRQLPAYLSFCRKYPEDGNAKLIEKIAAGFRRLVLTGKMPARMLRDQRILEDGRDR